MQRTMAIPRGLILTEPPRFILGNHNLSSLVCGSSKGSVTAMVQSPADNLFCSLSSCLYLPNSLPPVLTTLHLI